MPNERSFVRRRDIGRAIDRIFIMGIYNGCDISRCIASVNMNMNSSHYEHKARIKYRVVISEDTLKYILFSQTC